MEFLRYTCGAGDSWIGRFGVSSSFSLFCDADRFRIGLSFSHCVRDEEQVGSNNERTASVAIAYPYQ